MTNWIQNCQICNDGLCIRMEELKKEGHCERAAADIMAEEAYDAYPEMKKEFAAERIRRRYIYHWKEKNKKKVVQIVPPKTPKRTQQMYLSHLAEDLSRRFGTKIMIKKHGQKGKVEIEFYSNDDLDRLIDRLKEFCCY